MEYSSNLTINKTPKQEMTSIEESLLNSNIKILDKFKIELNEKFNKIGMLKADKQNGSNKIQRLRLVNSEYSKGNVAYEDHHRPCNCTKSYCLKLYCECFARDKLCVNCNCNNCMNNLNNEKSRSTALLRILDKNPMAFLPKIGSGQGQKLHRKGCNCKRSECLKNYCECREAKIECSLLCRCHGCKNRPSELNGLSSSSSVLPNETLEISLLDDDNNKSNIKSLGGKLTPNTIVDLTFEDSLSDPNINTVHTGSSINDSHDENVLLNSQITTATSTLVSNINSINRSQELDILSSSICSYINSGMGGIVDQQTDHTNANDFNSEIFTHHSSQPLQSIQQQYSNNHLDNLFDIKSNSYHLYDCFNKSDQLDKIYNKENILAMNYSTFNPTPPSKKARLCSWNGNYTDELSSNSNSINILGNVCYPNQEFTATANSNHVHHTNNLSGTRIQPNYNNTTSINQHNYNSRNENEIDPAIIVNDNLIAIKQQFALNRLNGANVLSDNQTNSRRFSQSLHQQHKSHSYHHKSYNNSTKYNKAYDSKALLLPLINYPQFNNQMTAPSINDNNEHIDNISIINNQSISQSTNKFKSSHYKVSNSSNLQYTNYEMGLYRSNYFNDIVNSNKNEISTYFNNTTTIHPSIATSQLSTELNTDNTDTTSLSYLNQSIVPLTANTKTSMDILEQDQPQSHIQNSIDNFLYCNSQLHNNYHSPSEQQLFTTINPIQSNNNTTENNLQQYNVNDVPIINNISTTSTALVFPHSQLHYGFSNFSSQFSHF